MLCVTGIRAHLESAGDACLKPAVWSGRVFTDFIITDDTLTKVMNAFALFLLSLPALISWGVGMALKEVVNLLPEEKAYSPVISSPILPKAKEVVNLLPEEKAYSPVISSPILPTIKAPAEKIAEIDAEIDELIHGADNYETFQKEMAEVRGHIRQFFEDYPASKETTILWTSLIDTLERSYHTWDLETNYRKQYIAAGFEMDESSVVHVPDDGNCAFHSLSALLKILGKEVDHASLRQEAYDYLIAHQEDEKGYISTAIKDYNQDIEDTLNSSISTYQTLLDEKQINVEQFNKLIEKDQIEAKNKMLLEKRDYIERVKDDRFWSGYPELYAVSMLYNVSIEVQSGHGKILISSDAPLNKERPLQLVYNCNHYNFMV